MAQSSIPSPTSTVPAQPALSPQLAPCSTTAQPTLPGSPLPPINLEAQPTSPLAVNPSNGADHSKSFSPLSDLFLSSSSLQTPSAHPLLPQDCVSTTQNKHSMVTGTKDKTQISSHFPDFIAHNMSSEFEPTTFKQAVSSPHRGSAMSKELNALARNNTWSLVPPLTNQKVISSKWVYKVKRNPDGSVERYKARLVAKGYNQEVDIDYMETYNPVVRATTYAWFCPWLFLPIGQFAKLMSLMLSSTVI
jgi:Reverse transcriptase (RNA-dependent DNA polymerase)